MASTTKTIYPVKSNYASIWGGLAGLCVGSVFGVMLSKSDFFKTLKQVKCKNTNYYSTNYELQPLLNEKYKKEIDKNDIPLIDKYFSTDIDNKFKSAVLNSQTEIYLSPSIRISHLMCLDKYKDTTSGRYAAKKEAILKRYVEHQGLIYKAKCGKIHDATISLNLDDS